MRPQEVDFRGPHEISGLALRGKFPNAPLAILADDDHGPSTNAGVEKAMLAAKAIQGHIMVPSFSDEEKARGVRDFKDLHAIGGLVRIKRPLEPVRDLDFQEKKRALGAKPEQTIVTRPAE